MGKQYPRRHPTNLALLSRLIEHTNGLNNGVQLRLLLTCARLTNSVTPLPLTAIPRPARKPSPAPAPAVLFVHLLIRPSQKRLKKALLLALSSLSLLILMEYSVHSSILRRCLAVVLTVGVLLGHHHHPKQPLCFHRPRYRRVWTCSRRCEMPRCWIEWLLLPLLQLGRTLWTQK